MNISGASYKSAELGLDKRMYSAPLTRVRMFNYDYLANLLYCVILLSFYVLVYRVLGYSFEGPIALLLLPILATVLVLMVSVGSFIGHFFSAKYGNMLAVNFYSFYKFSSIFHHFGSNFDRYNFLSHIYSSVYFKFSI